MFTGEIRNQDDSFLYFAYGSNMLSARLQERERCPTAIARGIADLEGYELRWHKKSIDGSGKCNIHDRIGEKVFGVLYEIDNSEKKALDRVEGLGKGYTQVEIDVRFQDTLVKATAYIADPKSIDQSLSPYSWYHAFVVAGAKEHALPANYISRLEAIHTKQDQDKERHNEKILLLKSSKVIST